MTEWTPVTASDRMSISVMDTLNEHFEHVADVFAAELSHVVPLRTIDTSAGILTMPTAAYINRIEDNIRDLSANGYHPSEMPAPKNWLGEDLDSPRLSYRDVNRWFESIGELINMAYGIKGRLPITGTFESGDNRTVQLFSR